MVWVGSPCTPERRGHQFKIRNRLSDFDYTQRGGIAQYSLESVSGRTTELIPATRPMIICEHCGVYWWGVGVANESSHPEIIAIIKDCFLENRDSDGIKILIDYIKSGNLH